jgi:hypothetical protein
MAKQSKYFAFYVNLFRNCAYLFLKCLCNEIFTSFFIVFLKSTAGVMKNDVYSFIISYLILKLSHFIYFELWRHKYELR